MKILVTGAAGFLGSRLARALLAGAPGLPKVSKLVAVDIAACHIDDPRVDWKTGTIADDRFTNSVVEADVDAVYHLAAVVSGQAEAEFDVGMRVNVDATRALLEVCRRLEKPPRFIFTSTLAVFGGSLPAIDGERAREDEDRKSTRLNSSHLVISYAVFCLKKKKKYRNCPA